MRHTPLRARLSGLFLLPFLLLPAACGGSEADSAAEGSGGSVTVEHAQGSTTVEGTPEKIVVFDVGYLATLDELGVKVAGVPAVENLPGDLAEYSGDTYPKVGSLFEPDYEKVNALAPDLIVVAGRSAAAYPELKKIAPTVDLTVDQTDFVGSFRARTEALGRLVGKEDQVGQRLSALDQSIADVRGRADERTGLIVLTTGGKISAHGPGGRFGIVHDVLGVKPAATGLKTDTHGNAVSHEFIAETDPDLLYVVDRDAAIGEEGQAAAQVLDNALVKQTEAAKNDKIVYLDAFTWYIAPTALGSVESMVKAVGDSLA
ncbi:siderophore ABC transporter substrate-binding protein [Actinocorallia populi]|uniref:siderophore ABC transporter substrate-binding protein n=1 Tax=Actinocorallia populi TaxID=2079200 RepID=UPI000D095380|nr:siderophore ABC transporter substrate-binding protein [Actinocorallia populi]